MAVAYVSKQETTSGGGTTTGLTAALPAGYTIGNLFVLTCHCWNTGAPTVTTPSGWTKVIDGDDNAKLYVTAKGRLYVWVKKAASSEPAPSLTPSAAAYVHALIEEYSGQNTTTPLDGTASAGTPDSDTDVNTPAITTAAANSLVLYIAVNYTGSGTWVPPAGTTTRHLATYSTLGSRLLASEILKATAGTVAATSHTRSFTADTALAATLAIQPVSAGVPVADFTGTPTSGATPLSVTFTDTSTNTPTSWLWDFGDGSTSTSQNPTHAYAYGGIYTVSLTATNTGGSNTKTRTAYITATEAVSFAHYPTYADLSAAGDGGVDIY